MIWQEFLAVLDEVRSEIRSTRQLKEQAPYPDPIYDKLHHLISRAQFGTLQPVEIIPPERVGTSDIPADLLACAPDEPKSDIKEVVDRGDGEGRMVIEKRKTPLVVRPPDVIEVTEKELVK